MRRILVMAVVFILIGVVWGAIDGAWAPAIVGIGALAVALVLVRLQR